VGHVTRELVRLSLPVIGLNVLSVLALAVDTAMCGRLEDGNTALAALGYASQVIFLLMVAMLGLTVGTVALVSRAHGAGNRDRVQHIMMQSAQLTLVIAVVVAVLGVLFSEEILALLGASSAVQKTGAEYLRPVLGATPFSYLFILYAAILRSLGNTLLAFFVALVLNGVNFGLNYCLILGNLGFPSWGVEGAGVGTAIAYLVGLMLLMGLVRAGAIEGVMLPVRLKRFDWGLVKQLLLVGGPAALDLVILNISFLALITLVGFLEEIAVAAHAIGLRVQSLAFVPGLSVSQVASSMVGNYLGSNDVARARETIWATIGVCLVIMTTLSVVLLLFVYPMTHLFDVQPGTRLEELSVLWNQILGWSMPIFGIHIALVAMMRGAGITKTSLFINAFSTFIVQIPLGFWLAFSLDLGVFGVWLSFPLAALAKVAMAVVVFRRGKWAQAGVHASG
jgi:putative MATE family efflux protein